MDITDTIFRGLFNKYIILGAIAIIIYMTGGFRFITQNPTMVVFLGIAVVVLYSIGGKK